MAVVLQRTDPLSAASEAVGSYYTAKRQREVENAAAAHQAAREGRQDMESDRSFGIQNADLGLRKAAGAREEKLFPGQITAQADTHQGAIDAHSSAALDMRIKQSEENYNKAVRPLELQMKALEVRFKRGEITSQAATLQHQQIQNQIDTFTAHHQAETQALEMAKGHAQINSENASAAASMHAANAPYYNPNAATDTYQKAISTLSPAATQFLQHIQSSGSSMTPLQAELAVRANKGLSPADQSSLMTILGNTTSADFQPLTGKPAKAPVSTAGDRQNAMLISNLQKNPKFKSLLPNQSSDLIQGIQHKGYDGAVTDYKAIAGGDQALSAKRGISQQDAQAVLNVLGVQTQNSGGGFFGLHF